MNKLKKKPTLEKEKEKEKDDGELNDSRKKSTYSKRRLSTDLDAKASDPIHVNNLFIVDKNLTIDVDKYEEDKQGTINGSHQDSINR